MGDLIQLNVILNIATVVVVTIVALIMGIYLLRIKRREYDSGTIASQDKRIVTLDLELGELHSVLKVLEAETEKCELDRARMGRETAERQLELER